ncbi:EamA family transporter [Aquicoccus sp. SCR17]|nr:EamA family transporter [Carideicomes alvinocaridis]
MELWIPVTVAAAFFQTLRFMLQKSVSTSDLTSAGATFARFFFSAPLVLTGVALWLWGSGMALPEFTTAFWIYGAIGGLAQIFATICVVAIFRTRNFAVGITFKKTEVVQTALVGLVVLGEGVSAWGFVAIVIGLAGVLLLSETPGLTGHWLRRMANRAAGLGLLSGFFFAISGVCYRGATLEIASDLPAFRAAVTLAAVVTFQALSLGLWLRLREPGQITRVWQARRRAGWIGVTSLAGSLCWFTAFTLQNAAYVNAVGQVELILSLFASVLVFHEKITAREGVGIALLGVSILGIVLAIGT